jgi:hypothetical protein
MTRDERAHDYLLAMIESHHDWEPETHQEFVCLAFELADEFIRQSATQETPLPEIENADDGWIEWTGGECPLPDGTPNQVKFRDGDISGIDSSPETWQWHHTGSQADIIAYKIVK